MGMAGNSWQYRASWRPGEWVIRTEQNQYPMPRPRETRQPIRAQGPDGHVAKGTPP